MELLKDKKYKVVVSQPLNRAGVFELYFRNVFLDKHGLPVFNFSDSLDESSVFYNFFILDDLFYIHPFIENSERSFCYV